MNNDNMFETYNLKEIKSIINQAVDAEIGFNRLFEQREMEIVNGLKVRLFDMFGIED